MLEAFLEMSNEMVGLFSLLFLLMEKSISFWLLLKRFSTLWVAECFSCLPFCLLVSFSEQLLVGV